MAATFFFRAICILGLVCLQTAVCYADTLEQIISTDNVRYKYPLGKDLRVLSDPTANLSIGDIVDPQSKREWSALKSKVFNKGFTSTAYWFRFLLDNPSDLPRELLLEVGYSLLDQIDVYLVDDARDIQNFEHLKGGDKLPFESRVIGQLDFVFPLRIESNSTRGVYIRVATTSSMLVPLTLWHPHAFVEDQQTEYLARDLFLGIIAVMAVYNLFLFFAIGDKSYLFYVLCLTTYALVEAILTGIAYPYLWPHSVWWNDKALIVVTCISLACIARFSKLFLNLDRQTPSIARVFDVYFLFCLAFAGFSLFLPYTITIRVTAIFVALIPLSV